ncbi:ATP-binding protein [Limosilactobacillus balticus]|uniref:DEAD/DEAH box helicase n=1 Tax=Limosilactobacillus balticus TaxID=2759747 RepID=UPI001E3139EB|nr:ATP-binding protein [Limosilactobacillus balticus]MCD7135792.1 ATP-binding protein [Limosilactobacillus balticus]
MNTLAESKSIISAWWWAERFNSGNLPPLGKNKWRTEEDPPMPGGKGSIAFLGLYNKTKLQRQISEVLFHAKREYNDSNQAGYSLVIYLDKDLKFNHVQIPYTTYLLFALKKKKTSVIHSEEGYNNFSERIDEICESVLSNTDSKNVFKKLLQLDIRISKDLGLSKEQEARLDMIPGDWNYRRQPVLLDSFFADDLNTVYNADHEDKLIHNYLFGSDHKEINEEWNILTDKVSLDNLPMGKWPSEIEFGSSLMQQFAINAITGHLSDPHNYIRTVNGPPGTGKTTLLKDVFAEMLVQQALVMSKLKTPKDGYLKPKSVRISKYFNSLYPLIPELTGYGIIVTSNNNSAVENISKDFPLIDEINQHVDKNKQNAFAEKIKKIDFFSGIGSKILAKDDDYPLDNIWGTFAIPMGNSSKTRKAFNYDKQLWGYLVHHKTTEDQWEKAVYYFKKQYQEVEELKQQLRKELLKNSTIKKWLTLSNDIKQLTVPYLINPQNKKENMLNEKLREARSNLFLESLNLRKKFICFPIKSIKGREKFPVLEAYQLFKQSYKMSKNEDIVTAFQDVQLLFPVISSTLASFHRMFEHFGENTLDNVFMDEAGQATPLSGVGAIWRAKHFIALGDPAQIKPVVTNEPSFLNFIADEKNVDYDKYLNPDLSVQQLADQANYYGHQEQDDPWIGMPLWVHRRCLEPMFTISNRISYHNHMVKGTHNSPNTKWNSEWIDSVGKAHDKFVKENVDALVNHICARIANQDLASIDMNDIFIISPFINVVKNIKQSLRNIFTDVDRKWFNTNIGTVHTFQGKEAKIVYFVVGTDKNSDGAANWSCAQPNLINVAATRAKKEFYVIGDLQRLSKKPNYSVVSEELSKKDNN